MTKIVIPDIPTKIFIISWSYDWEDSMEIVRTEAEVHAWIYESFDIDEDKRLDWDLVREAYNSGKWKSFQVEVYDLLTGKQTPYQFPEPVQQTRKLREYYIERHVDAYDVYATRVTASSPEEAAQIASTNEGEHTWRHQGVQTFDARNFFVFASQRDADRGAEPLYEEGDA